MINDTTTENPFWQFTIKLWQHIEIRQILLELQDSRGLNINLLLLMLWLAKHNILVSEEQLLLLRAITEPLDDEILQPLRQLRKALKTFPGIPDELYQSAQHLELALEKQHIHDLYLASQQFLPTENATSIPICNLSLYASESGDGIIPLLTELSLQVAQACTT